jgi:hypothetical protein
MYYQQRISNYRMLRGGGGEKYDIEKLNKEGIMKRFCVEARK